jgi:PII-like signaling protein
LGPYNATFLFIALFVVNIVLVNIYQALIQKTATVYRAFWGYPKSGRGILMIIALTVKLYKL